ncbi:MAG: SCO family protein [Bacteroidota bacterium]|nr:SCO family protein [Bacteroidota bacterium]
MKFFLLNMLLVVLIACRTNPKVQSSEQAAAVNTLPYYNGADFMPLWLSTKDSSYRLLHTIPSFSFTDQDSLAVTENTFRNKIYVANFFFTTCPGICKRLTTNLVKVQNALERDTSVLLLSHSVTPETDNVARLKQYAASFGVISGKWHLVTGNREQIYHLARQAYFADEDFGKQKTINDFLHTENVLLIDKHKHIRGIYKGTSELEMQTLIHDISILEHETF